MIMVELTHGNKTLVHVPIRSRRLYQLFKFKKESNDKQPVGEPCRGKDLTLKISLAKETGYYDGELLDSHYKYELHRTRCKKGTHELKDSKIPRMRTQMKKVLV